MTFSLASSPSRQSGGPSSGAGRVSRGRSHRRRRGLRVFFFLLLEALPLRLARRGRCRGRDRAPLRSFFQGKRPPEAARLGFPELARDLGGERRRSFVDRPPDAPGDSGPESEPLSFCIQRRRRGGHGPLGVFIFSGKRRKRERRGERVPAGDCRRRRKGLDCEDLARPGLSSAAFAVAFAAAARSPPGTELTALPRIRYFERDDEEDGGGSEGSGFRKPRRGARRRRGRSDEARKARRDRGGLAAALFFLFTPFFCGASAIVMRRKGGLLFNNEIVFDENYCYNKKSFLKHHFSFFLLPFSKRHGPKQAHAPLRGGSGDPPFLYLLRLERAHEIEGPLQSPFRRGTSDAPSARPPLARSRPPLDLRLRGHERSPQRARLRRGQRPRPKGFGIRSGLETRNGGGGCGGESSHGSGAGPPDPRGAVPRQQGGGKRIGQRENPRVGLSGGRGGAVRGGGVGKRGREAGKLLRGGSSGRGGRGGGAAAVEDELLLLLVLLRRMRKCSKLLLLLLLRVKGRPLMHLRLVLLLLLERVVHHHASLLLLRLERRPGASSLRAGLPLLLLLVAPISSSTAASTGALLPVLLLLRRRARREGVAASGRRSKRRRRRRIRHLLERLLLLSLHHHPLLLQRRRRRWQCALWRLRARAPVPARVGVEVAVLHPRLLSRRRL